MDDLRTNRQPAAHHQPHPQNNPAPALKPKRSGNNFKLIGWIIASCLIIGILGAGVIIGFRIWNTKSIISEIKKDKYQAVFLTNGQVYFGKVDQIIGDFVKMREIYYLQVQQTVQPKDPAKSTTEAQNQQLSLAKLGGELHGPEDTMYIDRGQIIFWENLKDDGKVVQAIKNANK